MTTLADKIEALARSAAQTADDIRYYSGGSKHNQPAEDLADLVMNNHPTILRALRERDQAVEALKLWREYYRANATSLEGRTLYDRAFKATYDTLASIEGARHE